MSAFENETTFYLFEIDNGDNHGNDVTLRGYFCYGRQYSYGCGGSI